MLIITKPVKIKTSYLVTSIYTINTNYKQTIKLSIYIMKSTLQTEQIKYT